MKRLFAVAVVVVSLAGCVSAGTKVDPNVVSSFQPGVTTLDQAEAKLGTPNSVTKLPDGTTVIGYAFTHAQASGSSYIPVVGAFVGHSDANTVIATLTFDKGGKYVQSSTTTSQTKAGMFTSQ
jgi:outer membrane protein assembly factor BamE (lipoprotein component of BamABCDE complex)